MQPGITYWGGTFNVVKAVWLSPLPAAAAAAGACAGACAAADDVAYDYEKDTSQSKHMLCLLCICLCQVILFACFLIEVSHACNPICICTSICTSGKHEKGTEKIKHEVKHRSKKISKEKKHTEKTFPLTASAAEGTSSDADAVAPH